MDDGSKQDPKMVNISDIQNAGFSDDTEPKDDQLMDLLKLAYTKKIYCRTVIVAIDNVVPFSDYQPIIVSPDDNWDGLISGTVIQVVKV